MKKAHDHVYDLITDDNEITWQTILLDLVKSEQMDPWDVNLTLLAQKYLQRVKAMEELNFFVSGKVVLASALLLKMKSNKLLLEQFPAFDQLFAQDEEMPEHEELIDDVPLPQAYAQKDMRLTIKTPQTRKRKVSVNDLVEALKQALEVEQRRTNRLIQQKSIPDNLVVPVKKMDINLLIKDLYGRLRNFLGSQKQVTFTNLVNSEKKEDKITTFIPLLHLSNQDKVHLEQPKHFEEIYVQLKKR
ncbi:hypothetical protein CL622_08040 [archaeon]|nr:hypothetical protein [archaeon]|tara:strand:- start:4043 stop:4777 length:735 start_codon:yes stop_codon:yes gene_type:complete